MFVMQVAERVWIEMEGLLALVLLTQERGHDVHR
jgi:hypothetical protein